MLLLLKNILFTVIMPGTIAVWLPLFWITDNTITEQIVNSSAASILGGILVGMGAAIYFWCLWDFAAFGRGTPAPIDAPKRLVVRGLYRFVRNPMYIGVLTVIAGWAVLFTSSYMIGYGLVIGLCFHLFILFVEEPILRNKFGEEYAQYCEQANRWIPRLGRK